MDPTALLALDQGTTSSRAMVFDLHGRVRALAQQELPQSYPAPGWVEHDPAAIWDTTLATARRALAAAGDSRVAAIGLTNQRETTLLWDRATGQPVAPAIVWQDRRTADHCARLGDRGHAERITAATGLVVDPYFSATKLAWLLEHVPGCRARAERGDLAFGTVDTWLLWNLTGGTVHATDATNAARTMLFDIHHQRWDPDLLALFDIPPAVLPEVRDSAETFGTTPADLFGRPLAVTGMAGDQQAALIGQACIRPGMMKSTYGTGCFMVVNTGARPVRSRHHLLTTVAYRLDGQVTYALEGAIFVAGAAVQWLRDGLGVIGGAAETEALAAGLADNRGVYLVPAFTGLGAPHWDPEVRGTLIGLTRDSGPAVLARAALESVGYQTADLMAAMTEGLPHPLEALRVDGGMVANDWFVQDLADILDLPVERPEVAETTAWGAACLAALGAGLVPDLQTLAARWRSGRRVAPALDPDIRARRLTGWRRALAAARVAAGHPIA